jgi:hypothetical protein
MRWAAWALIWVGSVLVGGSGVIHYHLWASLGYNNIPTIGPLFLFQAVASWVIAVITSLFRKWWLAGLEAVFSFATAAGLLWSVEVGLFGWQDSLSAPFAGMALSVELAGGVVLSLATSILVAPRLKGALKARRNQQLANRAA